MRTVIEGGWVVAWNGRGHEVHEQGSVVFEGDRVVHAGGPYAGPADARIRRGGKLVSPGFINTHVHTAGNGGDYLLLDMAKNDYRTANYMAFAAPLKGKMTPPPPSRRGRSGPSSSSTRSRTAPPPSSTWAACAGDWDGYARLVDDLGVRVYGGPPFRDRDTYMDAQGRLTYEEDVAVGRARLQEAVDFVQVRRGRAGPAARAAQRGPGRDLQRAAAAGGQGRGARARSADPHPRGRQPRRVPADHGRVPQDADPLPRRHRLPRRAHPARPRGLHHRARVDALSVRRRPARAGRARRAPSSTSPARRPALAGTPGRWQLAATARRSSRRTSRARWRPACSGG